MKIWLILFGFIAQHNRYHICKKYIQIIKASFSVRVSEKWMRDSVSIDGDKTEWNLSKGQKQPSMKVIQIVTIFVNCFEQCLW
jgi:hypothetical protein